MTTNLALPPLGSGWNQRAWCQNLECHAPIPSHLTECPECGAAQRPMVRRTTARDLVPLEALAAADCGLVRVYRHNELVEERQFPMEAVVAIERLLTCEQYRAACALGGAE